MNSKKQVVNEYLSGKGSYNYLAKIHGIPDKTPIQNWVQNYKFYGEEGLLRSRKKNKYSFEKKLAIVMLNLVGIVMILILQFRCMPVMEK